MPRTPRILENSTDTLLVYPPETSAGAPVSPEVRVGTLAVSLPDDDSWQAATPDPVSSTLSAEAAKRTTVLTFGVDPSLTPGRTYLALPTTGERVFFQASSTGTSASVADPLPMTLPVGTPIVGIAITHDLTAAETDIAGRGVVKVKATIDGDEQKWDVAFRVVRAIFGQGLTSHDLITRRPEMIPLRPATDDDYTETIEAAWDDIMEPHLAGRRYLIDRIHSLEPLFAPWSSACVWLSTRAARAERDQREAAERDFTNSLDLATRSVDLWYDSPGDDGTTGEEGHNEAAHDAMVVEL